MPLSLVDVIPSLFGFDQTDLTTEVLIQHPQRAWADRAIVDHSAIRVNLFWKRGDYPVQRSNGIRHSQARVSDQRPGCPQGILCGHSDADLKDELCQRQMPFRLRDAFVDQSGRTRSSTSEAAKPTWGHACSRLLLRPARHKWGTPSSRVVQALQISVPLKRWRRRPSATW
jgi:hypothetical protein